jgi:hypothetical protein
LKKGGRENPGPLPAWPGCRDAAAVDFDQGLFLGGHLVQQKGFADGIAAGGTVDKQQLEFIDRLFDSLKGFVDDIIGLEISLPVFGSATGCANTLSSTLPSSMGISV